MTTFTGPEEVNVFRAIAIKQGLKLLKLGIKPNRAWTLTNTLKAAGEYTGKHYKRSQIDTAIADMCEYLELVKAQRDAADGPSVTNNA